MSKLCQCKLSDLAKHINETVDTNTMLKEEVMEMLELEGGINTILESECVCFSYCESDHDHSKYKCIPRPGWKEKQSQSPCEHPKDSREFLLFNCQIPRTLEHTSRLLYLCHKCGLVTCLDPNRSGPSKNPNDK